MSITSCQRAVPNLWHLGPERSEGGLTAVLIETKILPSEWRRSVGAKHPRWRRSVAMFAADKMATSRSGGLPDPELFRHSTAFLTIDMQYLDAHRDFGVGESYAKAGNAAEADAYFTRIEDIVVPNIARLHEACRAAGVPLVHVRIMGSAGDGSDFSWRFKELGYLVLPGSKDAEILPELAPRDGEVVVSKTTAGAFNSTDIDAILRRMGIETLIVAGVVTNSCVESTVRDAGDRDFRVIVVEDGCAALDHEDHEASLRFLHRNFAVVQSTQDVIDQLKEIAD